MSPQPVTPQASPCKAVAACYGLPSAGGLVGGCVGLLGALVNGS